MSFKLGYFSNEVEMTLYKVIDLLLLLSANLCFIDEKNININIAIIQFVKKIIISLLSKDH